MNDITLESLIQEHIDLIAMMYLDRGFYYFRDHQAYEYWLAKTRRYLSTNFTNDKQVVEFDSISRGLLSKTQQQRMLAILEALTLLPNPIPIAKTRTEGDTKTDMNITSIIQTANLKAKSNRWLWSCLSRQ